MDLRLTAFVGMPFGPFDKPLDQLEAQDIDQLINLGPPESLYLDLKGGLSEKGGSLRQDAVSAWEENRTISDRSKQEIADAMIGFANADGGTLIIGIDETIDKPPRPKSIVPLPAAADLASRIRQVLGDIVDPPLTRLETTAVPIGDDGQGVVVLRTPPSPTAPHCQMREKAWRRAVVRRGDATVPMTMREIQDMVLQRDQEAMRFQRQFDSEVRALDTDAPAGFSPFDEASFHILRWSILVAPRIDLSLDLRRGLPGEGGQLQMSQRGGGLDTIGLADPHRSFHLARPIMGGRSFESYGGPKSETADRAQIRWLSNGSHRQRIYFHTPKFPDPDVGPELYARSLALAFQWIAGAREASNQPNLEFGMQLIIDNRSGVRMRAFGPTYDFLLAPEVESEKSVSPVYEVGVGEAFDHAVNAITHDFFNAFGKDFMDVSFVYRSLT